MRHVIQSLRSKARALHGILTLGAMTIGTHVLAASGGEFTNPIQSQKFEDILTGIADIITRVAIPFIVVAFVWVGFLFAAARGNEEKLTKAKEALTYTVVGGAVIAGTYVVIDLIQTIIG